MEYMETEGNEGPRQFTVNKAVKRTAQANAKSGKPHDAKIRMDLQ